MGTPTLETTITVSLGEMKVAAPPVNLAAVGIGSCVAVMVWDVKSGMGGMAHVMLPWKPPGTRLGTNLFKYADFAIDRMIAEIIDLGGRRESFGAKIVGGAHMFVGSKGAEQLEIGIRNVDAVKKKLSDEKIPLVSEETGGTYGRSVIMSLPDGMVRVRSVRQGVRIL